MAPRSLSCFRNTVCIVAADENVALRRIQMNKGIRKNLRAYLGDIVSVHSRPYCAKLAILPFKDTIEGLGDLFATVVRR